MSLDIKDLKLNKPTFESPASIITAVADNLELIQQYTDELKAALIALDAVDIKQNIMAGEDGKPISLDAFLRSLNENFQQPPKFAAGNFGGSDEAVFSLGGAVIARKFGKIWQVDYSLRVEENTITTSPNYAYGIDVRKVASALGFVPSLVVSTNGWRATYSAFDVAGIYMRTPLQYAGFLDRIAIRPAYLTPARVYNASGGSGTYSSNSALGAVGVQWMGTFYLEEI